MAFVAIAGKDRITGAAKDEIGLIVLRRGLSEAMFRRVFFVSLSILGAYIVASALS